MITPLDSYFADQAGRPRNRAEQQADDARSADFIASIARGRAALSRAVGRRVLQRTPAHEVAGGRATSQEG